MKKYTLIILLIISTTCNSQICKTVIATYSKSGTWGEWTGLIFTTDKQAEMRFLKTNNDEVELRRFWQDGTVVQDPEDVAGQLHTVKFSVGKKYLINYTTKPVEYKGMDEDGAQTIYENVIVTFEILGGDNINGASCKVFKNGELQAVAFGDRMYAINSDGKTNDEKIIQNKDEICRNGKCVKTIVDKDKTITTILLPDLNAKSLRGKVSGKEILQWHTDYQGQGKYISRGITYVGDMRLAAMATLIYNWF